MFEKLSPKSIRVVMFAQEEAKRLENQFVETEHILFGILKEGTSTASRLLLEKKLSLEFIGDKIRTITPTEKNKLIRYEIEFSPRTKNVIEIAIEEAEKLGEFLIEPEHLLLGIINLGEGLAINIIKEAGISLSKLRWYLLRQRETKDSYSEEEKTPLLDRLTEELTFISENEEFANIFIRENFTEELIQKLNLSFQLYPLILGEHGSGKTSLIKAVTQYILEGRTFKNFQNYRVVEFNFNNLLAEEYDFEKLNSLFKEFIIELEQNENIIIVFDNIANIFQDIFNMSGVISLLEMFLNSNEIHCIATSTPEDYKKIENSQLRKYFQLIKLEETNFFESKQILNNLKNKIQDFHDVEIDNSAIEACINFGKIFYPEKALPLCAINLLDFASSKKNFERNIYKFKIKDAEKTLKHLKNKRSEYLEQKNIDELEKVKKEAIFYEEEIKKLNLAILGNRPKLTLEDIKSLLKRETKGFI